VRSHCFLCTRYFEKISVFSDRYCVRIALRERRKEALRVVEAGRKAFCVRKSRRLLPSRLLVCRRRLGVCDVLEALLASLIRAMLSATSASVRRIGQTPRRNARVGTPVNSCEFMPVIGNLCRHAATHHAGSMHIALECRDPRFSHEIVHFMSDCRKCKPRLNSFCVPIFSLNHG